MIKVAYESFWTGTKRSSENELIDEIGETYTVEEFGVKMGLNIKDVPHAVSGKKFPESVVLTSDFKLRTNIVKTDCTCLCKTFDIPIWSG